MNKFIFCAIINGQISYGVLRAVDYVAAELFLKAHYVGRKLQAFELKAVANEDFEFDVVGGVLVY